MAQGVVPVLARGHELCVGGLEALANRGETRLEQAVVEGVVRVHRAARKHHAGAGEEQRTSGADGLRVVRILEAATESMNQRGSPVKLAR